MAERLVKLKFVGTPYIVHIDARSFTLKRVKNWNDKFPTPLGYHRSVFSLCDTLVKQGFQQVKGDLTVKTFVKKMTALWTDDVKPFLDTCAKEQKDLIKESVQASKVAEDYHKLATLVRQGKTKQAQELASTLDGK